MTRRLIAGLAVASIPVLGQTITPAASAGTACTNLGALTIPGVTIKSATAMPAGSFTPPGARVTANDDPPQARPASMTLPAFCRVEATARPTNDSEIKFEVWIPPADTWNGKFQ